MAAPPLNTALFSRAALALRCRYAHIHTNTYLHHTHLHTHIHTNTYTHYSVGRCPAPLKGGAATAVQVRTHTHRYTAHTCTHAYIPTHTHIILSEDAPRHLRAALPLRCIYAQIHTYTYVHNTHMHTHIHTNIYTHYSVARCTFLPHTLHVYISESDLYGNTKDEYIRHIHLRKRPRLEYTKRDPYEQKETKIE